MKKLINTLIVILALATFAQQGEAQLVASRSHSKMVVPSNAKISVFGEHSFKYSGAQKGIIETKRGDDKSYWVFAQNAMWSGASEEGYVDGYAQSFHNDDFVYPIGNRGVYRPIALSNSNEASAAYFHSNPTSINDRGSKMSADIESLSNLGYWNVQGKDQSKLTLTWDIDSELTDLTDGELSRLTMVGFDGDSWERISSTVDEKALAFGESLMTPSHIKSDEVKGSISSDESINFSKYEHFALARLSDEAYQPEMRIFAYPNPVVQNGYVIVDYSYGNKAGGKIHFQTMDNQIVKTVDLTNGKGKLKVNTDNLSKGVYWIMIESPTGKKSYQKLIVVDAVQK